MRPLKESAISIQGILLIALLFRGLLLFAGLTTENFENFYSYDSNSYLQPAREFLATGKFAQAGTPEIFRTPGYPLLLIPGILLRNVALTTILIQIALGVSNVFLVFQIGVSLFGNGLAAKAGALLMAIEPLGILFGNLLLSETLFTFTLLLFLWSLLKYFATKQAGYLFGSAVFLSATAYIRPISIYLPLIVAVFLLLKLAVDRKLAFRPIFHVFLFFFISAGLNGMWQVRNYAKTGYQEFSSVSDINWFFFHGASVAAVHEQVPLYDLQNQMGYRDANIYFQLHPEQKDWQDAQYYGYLRREGMQLVFSDLPTFLKVYSIGIARTLFDPASVEFLRFLGVYSLQPGILGVILDSRMEDLLQTLSSIFLENPHFFLATLLLLAFLFINYFLMLTGLFKSDARNHLPHLFPIIVFLYLLALSGGAPGTARFRVPMMPVICLFAGAGCQYWMKTASLARLKSRLLPIRKQAPARSSLQTRQ